jgi:hypothetical protein
MKMTGIGASVTVVSRLLVGWRIHPSWAGSPEFA